MEYCIDNIITTTAPLHISETGSSYFDPSTRQYAFSSKSGALPIARTKQIAFAALASEGGEEKSKDDIVPYVPGNTLRGALRRACADIMATVLEAKGEQVSFDLWHIVLSGASSASPEKSATISETIKAAKHPFVGMFGGGPKMIHGRMGVGNAFPIYARTLGLGSVPAAYSDYAINKPRTSALSFVHKDDFLQGSGQTVAVVENFDPELTKWVDMLTENKSKRGTDEDSGGKKGIAAALYREVMVPGTNLYSGVELNTNMAGKPMLGLYIKGLCAFANGQRLGGCWREGFGRFRITSLIRERNQPGNTSPVLTEVNGCYSPNIANPLVAEAIEAWDEYALNTLSAKNISDAFLL